MHDKTDKHTEGQIMPRHDLGPWSAVQVGFAFHRIEAALSVLIMKMADFSGLAAQTERLEALLDGETAAAETTEPTASVDAPRNKPQPSNAHLLASSSLCISRIPSTATRQGPMTSISGTEILNRCPSRQHHHVLIAMSVWLV